MQPFRVSKRTFRFEKYYAATLTFVRRLYLCRYFLHVYAFFYSIPTLVRRLCTNDRVEFSLKVNGVTRRPFRLRVVCVFSDRKLFDR